MQQFSIASIRKSLLNSIEVPQSIQERDISSQVKIFLKTPRIANMSSRNRQFKTESPSLKKVRLLPRKLKDDLLAERAVTARGKRREAARCELRSGLQFSPHGRILKSLQYLKQVALKTETELCYEELGRLFENPASCGTANRRVSETADGSYSQVESLKIIRKIREFEERKKKLKDSKDSKKRLSFHMLRCTKPVKSRNRVIKRKLTDSEPFEVAMERLTLGPLNY
eukprot:TRINITY_DN3445_c0_g1_i1.p1 TRINITY_DN3445_c0_g1~~TRINITY_DN3445_c0_g1_i1.p1  ORF type:complete len:227 (+),score=58.26 TRINITY_DN3445_c0_g1_i1:117-797(+)